MMVTRNYIRLSPCHPNKKESGLWLSPTIWQGWQRGVTGWQGDRWQGVTSQGDKLHLYILGASLQAVFFIFKSTTSTNTIRIIMKNYLKRETKLSIIAEALITIAVTPTIITMLLISTQSIVAPNHFAFTPSSKIMTNNNYPVWWR